LQNHLRDYRKAQNYKKNHCKYPSIDFYKTSKYNNNNFTSIFNYYNFDIYKTLNESLFNDNSKKKIKNNHIMNKTTSTPNLFNNKKIRKRVFDFKRDKEKEPKKFDNVIKKNFFKDFYVKQNINEEDKKENKSGSFTSDKNKSDIKNNYNYSTDGLNKKENISKIDNNVDKYFKENILINEENSYNQSNEYNNNEEKIENLNNNNIKDSKEGNKNINKDNNINIKNNNKEDNMKENKKGELIQSVIKELNEDIDEYNEDEKI
jgi:hypothetical protein